MFPGSRKVLILAGAQALMLSAAVLALGALIGSTLAPSPGLATLPLAVSS